MSKTATLAAPTFDPAGFILLRVRDDTTPGEARRRVNRVATLDGNVAINDFGFTDADRTLDLRWEPRDPAKEAAVLRLVQTYSTLIVSTEAGVFLAAPESYNPRSDESSLRLLVISRQSV